MDKIYSYIFEELVPRVMTYYELIKLDILNSFQTVKDFFIRSYTEGIVILFKKWWNQLQNHATASWAIGTLLVIYTLYQWVYLPLFQDFFLAECCRLKFENAESVKIGDTVVYTISGFIQSSKLNVRDSNVGALTQRFFNGLTARVTLRQQHIPAMKAYAEEESGKIRLIFTASKGGNYKVEIRYHGFIIPGCPFYVTVPPDTMFAGASEVQVPSTPILLIDSMPQTIVISPKDKTGYPCNGEGVRLDQFDFHASTAKSCTAICGKTCELIGGHWREVLEASFSFEPACGGMESESCRVLLVLRISYSQPSYGIFEGQILYSGQPLKNGTFPIISLTNEEYEKMEPTSTVPKPSDVVQFKAELIQSVVEPNSSNNGSASTEDVLVQEKAKEVYVNISLKFICIKEILWRVILSRTAIFKIQGGTKIEVIPENEDKLRYIVVISDETQLELRLRMTASNTRMFMALYMKFRAYTIENGLAFSEKSNAFLKSLKTHCIRRMNNCQRDRHQLLQISRPDALRTSYEGTKQFDCVKWCSPFIVSFIGEPLLEDDSAWLEWSELVLSTCFENNPLGMFHKISERSAFVHPNPSRNIKRWGTQYYELCGKILGKYLVERAFNPKSKSCRVKVRFSRSFLQQLIGSTPTSLTLERDMPELYESLLTTLQNTDLENGVLTFCIPEYDVFGKLDQMIPIIEDGESITVTKENLDLYLNALARYHLGSKVTHEIEAFRAGFSFIVPEDLLLNFDENELELLLCGWSDLDLHELKRHHIVDGEHWHPEFPRMMKWLWTALGNMSPVDQAKFLQFSTGSSILPMGGFAHVKPQLTFSMTCLYGQLPAADSSTHCICLSDHPTFEAFNEALLTSVRTAACCQPKPNQCTHDKSQSNLEIPVNADQLQLQSQI